MLEQLNRLLSSSDYTICESFTLTSRPAVFEPIPEFLEPTGIRKVLAEGAPNGLWRHQAQALRRYAEGRNIVVSTSTASGKSLIFRTLAFHTLATDKDARVLVFYPLKALAADQLRGWQAMAKSLGLPATVIGRIDGTIKSPAEREAILDQARVVIMTPDVCQAWLMARLSLPVVKRFIGSLALTVLDEAHTLEGVFGSNFAFLLRRLLVARHAIRQKGGRRHKAPRFVATTATIANPQSLLKLLSGYDFELIDEVLDGSPRRDLYCAHVVADQGTEMTVARSIQEGLLSGSKEGAFISFVDSRKGVEVLARSSEQALQELLGPESVLPYRSGFLDEDRTAIEQGLRDRTLRGVVSTSALEMGIDLPNLVIGINIGVPSSRKAYRQRQGRVGRATNGAFIVIAPPNAFLGYGTTFERYHAMSVENSNLYLDNRFMQFAHARCLVEELESLGEPVTLPTGIEWPAGFREVFPMAKPGGSRMPEFDAIHQLGGDSPHLQYPVRNIGEISFRISTQADGSDEIGTVTQSQALRECYPGGTYLHRGKSYEVTSWKTGGYGPPFIRLKPCSPARHTKPRIRTWINAGLTAEDVIEGHLRKSDNGFLVECQMQIDEGVEGYDETPPGEYRAYTELRQKNPNLKPMRRNFRTTGVVLGVNKPWFCKSGIKQAIASKLASVFAREYSIEERDIASSSTLISVRTGEPETSGRRADCIVIFDQTYGSLRLSERLFMHLDVLLDRVRAASLVDGSSPELIEAVDQLKAWHSALPAKSEMPVLTANNDGGSRYRTVFAPGSWVLFREQGQLVTDVKILKVTMDGELRYQVEGRPRVPTQAPVKRWIAARCIEESPDASQWSHANWDSVTEEFVPDDADPSLHELDDTGLSM